MRRSTVRDNLDIISAKNINEYCIIRRMIHDIPLTIWNRNGVNSLATSLTVWKISKFELHTLPMKYFLYKLSLTVPVVLTCRHNLSRWTCNKIPWAVIDLQIRFLTLEGYNYMTQLLYKFKCYFVHN